MRVPSPMIALYGTDDIAAGSGCKRVNNSSTPGSDTGPAAASNAAMGGASGASQ
ncbi:hypothetical protein OKW43_008226 [Paraburkholderia sp. WC7.3g]